MGEHAAIKFERRGSWRRNSVRTFANPCWIIKDVQTFERDVARKGEKKKMKGDNSETQTKKSENYLIN